MNKKTTQQVQALTAEREALIARMDELDAVFLAGNGSEAMEAEYYAAADRVNELRRLIHEAGRPAGRVCQHSAALVMANID